MDRTRRLLMSRQAEQIQSEMEGAFQALVNRMQHQVAGVWRPHLEVYETGNSLVVRAELAGIDEEVLDVSAGSASSQNARDVAARAAPHPIDASSIRCFSHPGKSS